MPVVVIEGGWSGLHGVAWVIRDHRRCDNNSKESNILHVDSLDLRKTACSADQTVGNIKVSGSITKELFNLFSI